MQKTGKNDMFLYRVSGTISGGEVLTKFCFPTIEQDDKFPLGILCG